MQDIVAKLVPGITEGISCSNIHNIVIKHLWSSWGKECSRSEHTRWQDAATCSGITLQTVFTATSWTKSSQIEFLWLFVARKFCCRVNFRRQFILVTCHTTCCLTCTQDWFVAATCCLVCSNLKKDMLNQDFNYLKLLSINFSNKLYISIC